MALLTKDQISSATDLELTTLPIPEWGGDVGVLDLNIEQREEIEAKAHAAEKSANALGWKGLAALVVSYALVDENRQRLFAKPEDLAALAKKSSKAMKRVFTFVMKRNGISEAEAKALAGN
jgi:hypothetical protein